MSEIQCIIGLIFFQISDLAFAASEFKILFLQFGLCSLHSFKVYCTIACKSSRTLFCARVAVRLAAQAVAH